MAVVKSPKHAKHKKLWIRKYQVSCSKKYYLSRTYLASPDESDLVYIKPYSWNWSDWHMQQELKATILTTYISEHLHH